MYIVYSISYHYDYPFYMICSDYYDEVCLNYPHILPCCLFKIINNRFSEHWIEKEYDKSQYNDENSKRIGFKEYVNDEFFYGKLADGHEKEINVFQKYKTLIDLENLE